MEEAERGADVVAARKYFCDVYRKACQSNSKLAQHYRTKVHADRVRAAGRPPRQQVALDEEPSETRGAAIQANCIAADMESMRYYCHICDVAFGTKQRLDRHHGTAKHAKAVRDARST